MNYLRVKNWERFQHYKDRDPLWIKVYVDLLSNYEFANLPDAAKGQLVGIWLLASKTEGAIPDDPKWIAKKINASGRLYLSAITAAGFLLAETYESDSTHASVSVSNSSSVSEFNPEYEFESLWAKYPRPEGKKAARKYFDASVQDLVALEDIKSAMDSYIEKTRGTEERFIKHGSTWFNNWRDYVPKARTAGEDAQLRRDEIREAARCLTAAARRDPESDEAKYLSWLAPAGQIRDDAITFEEWLKRKGTA